LSLAASVLTVWAQQKAEAMLMEPPLSLRLENAAVSYAVYLGKFFWPVNLVVYYPYPSTMALWQTAGAILLLGAISLAVVCGLKQRRYLGVGWFWFLGTLFPVIGLVQVGSQAMADRYTYVPSIGLGIMMSWGLAELAEAWPRGRTALASVAALTMVFCLAMTWPQVQYWRNSVALFEHAVKATSGNCMAENKLGILLDRNGKFEEAIMHFREALRLNPRMADTYYNLAAIYAAQHRMDDALANCKEAIRLAPTAPQCMNELAWFYATCPRAEIRNGPEAVRLAEQACQITKRQDTDMLDTLAAAYAETGRFAEAIKTAEEIRILALLAHDTNSAVAVNKRLELYQAGKPYRDQN
jgi:protein O-mannosyl-transferase